LLRLSTTIYIPIIMKKIILFLFILTAGLSKVKAQSSTIAWQYTTAATQ
jgi:hypothetical protein